MRRLQVIHVVDHGDEEVEKELAAMLHLILHRAAALESMASANDECQVVSAQLGVAVRSVGVCEARRRQDGRALYARLQALLLQRKLLQLLKPVLFSLAVYDGILEDRSSRGLNNGFIGAIGVAAVFEVPAIALLVVLHAWEVVALVEVLQNTREDFGLFIGKVNALVRGLEELAGTGGMEPWRVTQDVFVCGKEPLLSSDADGDDGTDGCHQYMARLVKLKVKTNLPSVGDVWLDCGDCACACCASLSILRGESLNDEVVFLCDFDLLARCFEKLASACRRLDENMMKTDRTASIRGNDGAGVRSALILRLSCATSR